MIYAYLITVTMKIEYHNNVLGEWSNPKNLYGYKSLKDAQKDIWKMRQKESKEYSRWLRKDEETRGLFIHHFLNIETIDIFQTSIQD